MTPVMPLQGLRVEQLMTYLRVFGLVVGVPTILLADFPDPQRLRLAWGIHAVLLLGTAGLALWRRHTRQCDETLVLVAGFVLDAIVIAGYVLAFSHLEPNVAWAMIFTLLADGALRFGFLGSLVGLILSGLLFIAQAQAHAAVTGDDTPLAAHLFVLGTLVGAAGLVAVFTTALARQARVSQRQALALADAQRFRERLLAMSGHEFRGSLAALVLATRTVRGNTARLGPERADALLREVERHARNLERLTEDLFAAARAEGQALQVDRRWDDLPSSLRVALVAAERFRDEHVVEMSVPPVACEIDHERVQQVVRNLVENAYKYAPAGSRVTVDAAQRDGHLEIRVGDAGPGIPPSEQERVFEPFRRRRGDSTDQDNAGLGLYVVKQLVAAMDGTVELHTSSRGSEFAIRLPAQTRAPSTGPTEGMTLNSKRPDPAADGVGG